LVHFIQ